MNKNWLIGIVVVVALGVLAYLGTNTDLFKGALGGEKGGLPAVTEARCTMILDKMLNAGLVSTEYKYFDACKYAGYNFIAKVCIGLKKKLDQGSLSGNTFNLSQAHVCANDYPSSWYGFASPQSCKAIQKWLNENKITGSAYFDEKLKCAEKYPDLYGSWKPSN